MPSGLLWVVGLVVIWFVLTRFVLPKAGVPT